MSDGRVFLGWRCKHGGPNREGRTCHLLKASKEEISGHYCTPIRVFRKAPKWTRELPAGITVAEVLEDLKERET